MTHHMRVFWALSAWPCWSRSVCATTLRSHRRGILRISLWPPMRTHACPKHVWSGKDHRASLGRLGAHGDGIMGMFWALSVAVVESLAQQPGNQSLNF